MSLSVKSFNFAKIALPLYLICLLTPIAIVLKADSSLQKQVVVGGNKNHLLQDRKAETNRLFQLGIQQYRRRKYQEALEKFSQVLVLSRETDDKINQARSWRQIGSIYFRQRRYQLALESYREALKIYRTMGDLAGEGRIWKRIGTIYLVQKRYPDAKESFLQASAVYGKLGDRKRQLFFRNLAEQITDTKFAARGTGNIIRDDD